MPAVRVRDALRYASKFVGLVLAGVIVAGGFVAGGVYLAADAISLSDPSLNALSETPVFIGVVLLAIGAILGAIALIALAYKFLADGIATAIAARDLGEAAGSAAVTEGDDEGAGETSSSASSDESTSGIADPTTGPSSNGSPSSDGAEEAVETTAPGPDVEQPGATPSTTDPADGPVGAPSAATNDSGPGETARGDDNAVDADPFESTGSVEPEDPPEWTPPDPSEFEEPGSRASDGDSETDQWADERAEHSDGGDEALAGDEAMTGDEARAGGGPESDWDGGDAADEVGTSMRQGSSEGRAVDGTGADEPSATDAGADGEDSSVDPDEIDENATLADEGVESFSAASDDDPLSDRLPGSDDN